ncbi:ABC transporter permease [Muricoccus pecuniae]|uniref:NitT/TauT family transport system permease protein n=1 Tax=Muricoccus pecuniae TaxID=693023 RepID=A0A840YJ12_9PROT|nr:ABC transporter permease subunit [Roseomonas pecuniae]MBB5694093.1 NitT/TauT family transport system permease protein [Roseomonas pecuniae]
MSAVLRALRASWGILAILLFWQIWVGLSGVNSIVLPGPAAILRSLADAPGLYLSSTAQTLALAALGLVLGLLLGAGLAVLTWFSSLLAGLLTPLGIIFASVPVVALIPVLARIFGYDMRTVLAIVVIISFFPSFVFTGAGLRALPPGSADLFRVLGASTWRRLTLLALPAAVPDMSVALRLAAANSILAAMVAEFLMGTSGLGYLFAAARSDFDMEKALAASAIATVISVTSFLLASRVENWAARNWR